MPKTIQSQTFTVTLSTEAADSALQDAIDGALQDLRIDGFVATLLTATDVATTTVETDQERSQREAEELTAAREAEAAAEAVAAAKRQRDLKLLELKGWLYGEHLKQEAGLPSEWNQGAWGRQTACGTSACIAGKTVLEAGGTFVKLEYGNGWNDPDTWRDPHPGEITEFSWARTPAGEHVRISDWAEQLLGLTYTQRSALFEGSNNYAMAAAIIDAIIDDTDPYVARSAAMDAL